jgi:hypothetical protein
MASSDRTTQRAEQIREATGMSWELACRIAERERDNVPRIVALRDEITRLGRRVDNVRTDAMWEAGQARLTALWDELSAVTGGTVSSIPADQSEPIRYSRVR